VAGKRGLSGEDGFVNQYFKLMRLYAILAGMMNELIFIFHTLCVFGVVCGAVLLGRHTVQALVCIYIVLANLFIVKKMLLVGCIASGSDMYVMGSMCALMIGAALWGERFARETAMLSVAVSLFFFMLCWFQVAYVPLPVDSMHETFALLLARMPHITFFSIVAHYCAQLCTLALSSAVRMLCKGWLQAGGLVAAMVLGQVVDGIIFFGGAFGLTTPVYTLAQMIGVSVCLKMLCIVASSALVVGAVWYKERGHVQ
jgi:uncharacterized integral membrane protein (TIGR00697 family)